MIDQVISRICAVVGFATNGAFLLDRQGATEFVELMDLFTCILYLVFCTYITTGPNGGL